MDQNCPDFHLVKIGDHTFLLEECQDHTIGLRNREHLHEKEGMLFKFNDTGERSFHMKECLLPLDILFIENGKVKKIFHECDPCELDECYKYACDSADLVVELLGGTCKKNQINEGLIYRHF